MNIQSNPIKTWKAEEGEVRLFCEKGTLKFDFKSPYKIHKIAIENIKGLPEKAQKTKNCTEQTISLLFKNIYPKVIELENGDFSLKFIDNCFEGMKISVNLLSKTIPLEDDEPIGLPEETLTLIVNPTDTITKIKEKIQQTVQSLSNEPLVLIYQNETLKSLASLVNCEISDGATISQAEKSLWENNKVCFEFNSLQQKKTVDFDKTAPAYRTVGPGLNMKGKCIKKGCVAANKVIWIRKGMGTFDIGKEAYISTCPMCKEIADAVNNLGFWDCVFSVEGYQFTPKRKELIMNDKIAGKEKFTTFAESNDLAKWSYLKITTKPNV